MSETQLTTHLVALAQNVLEVARQKQVGRRVAHLVRTRTGCRLAAAATAATSAAISPTSNSVPHSALETCRIARFAQN